MCQQMFYYGSDAGREALIPECNAGKRLIIAGCGCQNCIPQMAPLGRAAGCR